MPRKSAAGRGRRRENESGEESTPPAKVAKTVAKGEWRSSSVLEKDLLRLIAERVLQEKGVRQECWLEKLSEEESRDIPKLMKQIQALKDKGVTGESVAYSFIERCIQPLQQHIHLRFKYQGIQDPSRMARNMPSVEEIMRRVTRLFTGVHLEPYIPKLFDAGNSPDPPVFEEPAQDLPAEKAMEDAVADLPRP
ncbi:putative gypsy-type retrotransposon [Panicum miliaceum]|uniref:Gypsy-type retrotransposon n=1 Tax=Panicum miliaceum TaxID=4540 RepID=A0A3L6Q2C4_PANMI|nr:putative gypsy-type retrotransposon [Panicum miliaceum]